MVKIIIPSLREASFFGIGLFLGVLLKLNFSMRPEIPPEAIGDVAEAVMEHIDKKSKNRRSKSEVSEDK